MKVNKLNESFYPSHADKIELEYNDLDITLRGPQTDVDEWDEEELQVSWTYEVDKEDLYTYIFEECITKDDFALAFEDTFSLENEKDWMAFEEWLDSNFESVYSKYEKKILDYYEDDAREDAEEHYDSDDYIDWDMMPGGHDDYDFDDEF